MWRDNDVFKEYHSCQRGLNIAWKEDMATNDDKKILFVDTYTCFSHKTTCILGEMIINMTKIQFFSHFSGFH